MQKFLPVAGLLWAALLVPIPPLLAEEAEKEEQNYHLTSFEASEFKPDWDGQTLPKAWNVESGDVRVDRDAAYRGEKGLTLAANDPKKGPTQLEFSCDVEGRAEAEAGKATHINLTVSVMMRVSASANAEGHEFLDFDGALLALVKDADSGQAELQLFHNVDGDNGWWFSTGAKFPLCSHGLTAWLEITVTRDYKRNTYGVWVDGQNIMGGISAYPPRQVDRAHVWFFGGEKTTHLLDDFYIGPGAEPEKRMELREKLTPKLAEADLDAPPAALEQQKGAKTFRLPSRYLERRRKQQVGEDAPTNRVPMLKSGSIQVYTADEMLNASEIDFRKTKDVVDRKKNPQNELPVTFCITLNADIQEGLRLDHVTWLIERQVKKEGSYVPEVYATGDFGDGLVQEVEMPYELYAVDTITVRIQRH